MAPSSIVATSLDLEYLFKRTTDDRSAPPANMPGTGFVPTGWTNHRMGVDSVRQCEWVSARRKNGTVWSAFSSPVLWAKFGLT